MEAVYYAARANLRRLLILHPACILSYLNRDETVKERKLRLLKENRRIASALPTITEPLLPSRADAALATRL